jgi:hypothetical protein
MLNNQRVFSTKLSIIIYTRGYLAMYSPSIQNYPSNSPGVFPLGLEVVSPASGAHSLPQDCPENPGKMGRSPASRRFVWKLVIIIFPLCSLVEWPFEGIAQFQTHTHTHMMEHLVSIQQYPTNMEICSIKHVWMWISPGKIGHVWGYRFTRCGMKIGQIPQHLNII